MVGPLKLVTTVKENAPWFDLLKQLTSSFTGGLLRVLLIGPPGTGKSKTSLVLTDTPYRVTMTEGMGVEDLIGMYQLIKAETVWVDGPVVRAMREGKRILIDEVDHHPTEVGSLLYAFLDDSPEIMLPTGEKVTAMPGYGVIATTNSNVTALPEAVLDRFEAILPAIVPHPDALVQFSNDAMRSAVSNHFTHLDRTPWSWSGKPTLRRMAAFARLKEVVGEGNAANLAFGSAGREVLAVMGTASRTGKTEGL
jgi:nitric oxide reductase NorQ protein